MLRFLGSFGVALLVVAVMLATGVRVHNALEPEQETLKFHDVELLTAIERVRFADELGESRTRVAPKLPPLKEIPPVEIQRQAQGFVQLEVVIDHAGKVSDVRVLGATPAGIYEDNAIEQVRGKRYPPSATGNDRIVEIVEFKVPAVVPER
jgi:TonB family protein